MSDLMDQAQSTQDVQAKQKPEPANTGADSFDVKSLKPDVVEALINQDDGWKKWAQAREDKRVTQAIDTFKEKTLPKILQERENKIREELLPSETPEQKRLKDLERQMAAATEKARQMEIDNFLITKASNMQLTDVGEFAQYLKFSEASEAKKFLDILKARDKANQEVGKSSFLKQSAYNPQGGDADEKDAFASLEEYGRYLKKYPEKYDSELYKRIADKENRR